MTPSAQAAPAGGAPAAPTADEFAALKTQIADLTGKAAQADEFKRTAEYWHGKATAPAQPKTPDAQADEDEADLLEIITSKGAKGLDALLKARGFVSAAEVTTMVDTKAKQIEAEGQLVKDFPELKDPNSDFFKATAAAFGQLKNEGVPEARAMVTAAKETALDFIRAGKMKTPTQIADDAKAAREAARLARVAAQASSGGGRGAPEEDEGNDELTPEQRHIAISLLGGNGVSDDDAIAKYKARAQKGVALSSKK